MEKKIYCGSGKKQNDTWMKATINMDKIQEHIEEFKGTKFVRININIKEEADQFGKDVSITVDKWQPKKKEETKEKTNDKLPF